MLPLEMNAEDQQETSELPNTWTEGERGISSGGCVEQRPHGCVLLAKCWMLTGLSSTTYDGNCFREFYCLTSI